MRLNLDKSAWKQVAFGDVVANLNVTVKDPGAEGIHRVIAMEHLDPGELKISRWGDLSDGTTFTRRVSPGQTLFGKRRAYQRKAAYAEFDAICSGDILVFEADPQRLLPELLPFLVQSKGFYDHALGTSAGSLSPRTNWRDLASFEFDLPPIDEQKRIAELLWSAAREVSSQRHLLCVLERVSDRWMGNLATSEEGRITLESLIVESIGGAWGTEPGTGDIDVRVVRGTDISISGSIDMRSAPVRSVKHSEAEKRLLRVGDLLLEKSGGSPDQPVGKVGLVSEIEAGAVPSNFVFLIRTEASLCLPEYLFIVLRGMWRTGRFARFTGKTTNIANLRTSELFKTTVPLPDMKAQVELVSSYRKHELVLALSHEMHRKSERLMSALSKEIFGDAA
jgi:type I restriction enzyme S subunit